MSEDSSENEDNKVLAALALALLWHPRASLQELAKYIGVSKATLYRFCPTREELEGRLFAHGARLVTEAIEKAMLMTAPPLEALRRLFANSLQHKEITAFMTYHWKPDEDCDAFGWLTNLDAFFLRGQREGVFRIDISAQALTEIFGSLLVGLVDAERRGRVAKAHLAEVFESSFLNGVAAA